LKPAVRQLLMSRRYEVLNPSNFRGDSAAAGLTTATPDATGELIHPSVHDFGSGNTWNSYRYWMAATPYFGTDSTIENPCIYASNDLTTWATPATNPIDAWPGGSGYNSDTHMVYGNDGYLYCFYREYQPANTGSEERICYRRSSDGVTWGAEVVSLSNNQSVRRLVAPAINWDGVQWVMYAVDIVPATYQVVRCTAASLGGPWTTPQVCSVTAPDGYQLWHLDAKYVQKQWVLLLNYSIGVAGLLYLHTSRDGLVFARAAEGPIPLAGSFHVQQYRSCLIPKTVDGKTAFDLIYTGTTTDSHYKLGKSSLVQFDYDGYVAEPTRALTGAAPYVVGDGFERTDGVLGNATTGQAWVTGVGAPVIVSGKAAASTAVNTRAYVETNLANGYFEVNMTHTGAATQTWLVFRLSDANNFWRLGFNGGDLKLEKIVAGVATAIVTGTSVWVFYDSPTSIRVGVRCSGSDLTVTIAGKAAYYSTDAFNNTATKVGIQTQNTASRFDNFFARSLVNGA
jgi:hypothetical protein